MYSIKKEVAEGIKRKYVIDNLAKECGLSHCYMSLVMNGKKFKSKPIAYIITKMVDKEKEIEDFFDFTAKEK